MIGYDVTVINKQMMAIMTILKNSVPHNKIQ